MLAILGDFTSVSPNCSTIEHGVNPFAQEAGCVQYFLLIVLAVMMPELARKYVHTHILRAIETHSIVRVPLAEAHISVYAGARFLEMHGKNMTVPGKQIA